MDSMFRMIPPPCRVIYFPTAARPGYASDEYYGKTEVKDSLLQRKFCVRRQPLKRHRLERLHAWTRLAIAFAIDLRFASPALPRETLGVGRELIGISRVLGSMSRVATRRRSMLHFQCSMPDLPRRQDPLWEPVVMIVTVTTQALD
jgi:hypothetical protein